VGNAAGAQPGPSSEKTSVVESMLSAEASVVATLSGRAASGLQTYDATGLLTQVQQASQAAALAAVQSSVAGQGTSTTDSAAADGATATTPGPVIPGDWASIVKANPSMAGIAIADAVDHGIVNTINVVA
jgi:hypothetical protein